MSGNPENRTQVPPGPGLESQDKNFVSGGSVPNGPTSKDLENPHPTTNLHQTGDYATTGVDNPLKKYTESVTPSADMFRVVESSRSSPSAFDNTHQLGEEATRDGRKSILARLQRLEGR